MARLTIRACPPGQEVIIEEEDFQKIIDSCDPYDRISIEEEIKKIFNQQRPDETLNIHIFSLQPFDYIATVGAVKENWWEDGV